MYYYSNLQKEHTINKVEIMTKKSTKPITKKELEEFEKADKNAAKYIKDVDSTFKYPE